MKIHPRIVKTFAHEGILRQPPIDLQFSPTDFHELKKSVKENILHTLKEMGPECFQEILNPRFLFFQLLTDKQRLVNLCFTD